MQVWQQIKCMDWTECKEWMCEIQHWSQGSSEVQWGEERTAFKWMNEWHCRAYFSQVSWTHLAACRCMLSFLYPGFPSPLNRKVNILLIIIILASSWLRNSTRISNIVIRCVTWRNCFCLDLYFVFGCNGRCTCISTCHTSHIEERCSRTWQEIHSRNIPSGGAWCLLFDGHICRWLGRGGTWYWRGRWTV